MLDNYDVDKLVEIDDSRYINGERHKFSSGYLDDDEDDPDRFWDELSYSERRECIEVYRDWLGRHS